MLKEIVWTVAKLLGPIVLVIIGIIVFFVFRLDRYIFDFNGEFRRSCRALNNKELNAERINQVPGTISWYLDYMSTKEVTEAHISGYKEYIKEQKACYSISSYGKDCDSSYDFIGIYRTAVTEDWRCYVTVDPNTYIMTSEADYYTD